MSAIFANVAVGDQVQMSAKRHPLYSVFKDGKNPDRVVSVAVVTHRWHDPFEGKDYVALGMLLSDGTVSKPKEKRTIRGLAQAGWRPATQDFMAMACAANRGDVTPIWSRRA